MHTLVFNLAVAGVITLGSFGLFVISLRVPGTPFKIALFLAGVLLFAYAVNWNLTPGRLADAVRIYSAHGWEWVAYAWPIFLWTALFCLYGIQEQPKKSP